MRVAATASSTTTSAKPATMSIAGVLTVPTPAQHKSPAPCSLVANGTGNGYSAPTTATMDPVNRVYAPAEVFTCPEESLFYSQCLQRVLNGGLMSTAQPEQQKGGPPLIVEFGAGDGSPVLDALLKTGDKFKGRVHGFELNPRAASVARARCNTLGLNGKYHVHHSCFFKGAEELRQDAAWLVANPPYLPAPDDDLLMPELHGGVDGATLTNDLLSLGYPNAMLLVSSYSNPLSTLKHAESLGYQVADFLVAPLPFGTYSSEPKVKNWIKKMKSEGTAFYSERGWYLLSGVLFQKQPMGSDGTNATTDASKELIRVLTAL